jgi:2-oxo-3-hexenedioate decarboxylase
MAMSASETGAIAGEILAASDAARSIAPLSKRLPGFGLPEAYAVATEVIRRRTERGERRIGWKIGFTNVTIWDEYDVHGPIWGPMYGTTVRAVDPASVKHADLGPLVEPRIEPEIAFRFAAVPDPSMDEAALLGCIDGVAHGFEIVQSLYPQWKFAAADTVAAFALHGRYFCGPFAPVAAAEDRLRWLGLLAKFGIALTCDGHEVDRGQGTNVLGGPLTALGHFVRGLAETTGERVAAGDIVTTGTITRAFPVVSGQRWASMLAGLPLPGLTLAIA